MQPDVTEAFVWVGWRYCGGGDSADARSFFEAGGRYRTAMSLDDLINYLAPLFGGWMGFTHTAALDQATIHNRDLLTALWHQGPKPGWDVPDLETLALLQLLDERLGWGYFPKENHEQSR